MTSDVQVPRRFKKGEARRVQDIDVHIGQQLRLRRLTLRISQEQLAEMLGLTFQQLQKYEPGKNRVSAARLYALAALLKVRLEFFFDGLPAPDTERDAPARPSLMLKDKQGVELITAFSAIRDSSTRKHLLKLVQHLVLATDDREELGLEGKAMHAIDQGGVTLFQL